MKIIKSASGKSKLSISRKEWEEMGKQAGWGQVVKDLVTPLVDPLKKALEPDRTNPYVPKDEEDGTISLTKDFNEQNAMQVGANSINIEEVANKLNSMSTTDPGILLAIPKALDFVRNPPQRVPQKTVDGMKIILFRIVSLPPGKNLQQAKAILKKWHQEKVESEKMWEKPKNPYL